MYIYIYIYINWFTWNANMLSILQICLIIRFLVKVARISGVAVANLWTHPLSDITNPCAGKSANQLVWAANPWQTHPQIILLVTLCILMNILSNIPMIPLQIPTIPPCLLVINSFKVREKEYSHESNLPSNQRDHHHHSYLWKFITG